MIKHQGGCHCGNIRFTTEYDPLLVAQCNCSRCRRIFGVLSCSPLFGETELIVTGSPKVYKCKGGSGMDVWINFCPDCGCRVFSKFEAFEGFMGIPIGAFDDPHQFSPSNEIFTNYKLKWVKSDECIKESFEEAAVMERLQALMENMDQREG